MLVRHHRLAIAGVLTATAIAVPAAALASGSGSPSGKPAPPQASAASASKAAAGRSQLPALAASAGISVSRLQAGLVAAKGVGGNTAASIAAFAASTGVSHATAQRVVYALFGTQVIKRPSLTGPPAPVRAFATRLGVSTSAAGRALRRTPGLAGKNGSRPASPRFAPSPPVPGAAPARLPHP